MSKKSRKIVNEALKIAIQKMLTEGKITPEQAERLWKEQKLDE